MVWCSVFGITIGGGTFCRGGGSLLCTFLLKQVELILFHLRVRHSLVGVSLELNVRDAKVEVHGRVRIVVLASYLGDHDLDQGVLIVHKEVGFILPLLTDDQLRREVWDYLIVIVGEPIFLNILDEDWVLLRFLEAFTLLLPVLTDPFIFKGLQVVKCLEDCVVLGLEVSV